MKLEVPLKLGSIILLLLWTGNLHAQIDPDTNSIGVYFDQTATVVTAGADPMSVVSAYLVLTNPSEIGDIRFWSAIVTQSFPEVYNGPAHVEGTPRFGRNDWIPMAGANDVAFFVFIDFPIIQSLEQITVLADLEIFLFGDSDALPLYLVGHLGYTLDEFVGWDMPTFVNCARSTGDMSLPVAVINGNTPVSNEAQSWGQLKSLFR